MSIRTLRSGLLSQMQTAGPVYFREAPAGTRGTYATARLDLRDRPGERITYLLDLRVDVYSQESEAAAYDLAEALCDALNGWTPPGASGPLTTGSVQNVPPDQTDPKMSRLTIEVTGVIVRTSGPKEDEVS